MILNVEIADELGVAWPVAEEFEKFASNIKSFSPEYVVSRGEWFTCQILAEYLGLPFVDAADVMLFRHDGTAERQQHPHTAGHATQQGSGR